MVNLMKRKHIGILFLTLIILLIPTQTSAISFIKNESDGTEYKLVANFKNTYVNHSLFEILLELEAVTFGTLEGVIVGFYDIEIDISISGDSVFLTDNTTLTDINIVGGSSSTTLSYNLSGIPFEQFTVATHFQFKGNNTQGDDPTYGLIWVPGFVRVKEANAAIIAPIIAVLCLTYLVKKKRKTSKLN